MRCVIGLDIGTTSTIGLVLAPPADIVAVASRPVHLSALHPGWAEEDPEQWWDNACAVLRELTAALPPGARLEALCVTGMLPATVLLDSAGHLLRPSIQQSDSRCGREVAELAREVDPEWFLATTGNGLNQQIVSAKLRWIETHEPDVFARIATVFGSYDYVNWRLTGVRAIERNWALEAGFVDLADHAISDRLVALAHVPRAAAPDLISSQSVLGAVTQQASAATGLPRGLPVLGGAADHMASTLAAGIVAPGDVLLKFGGSADIIVASDHLRPDARLYTDYHLIPGLYAPNGCMASGGSALNWMAGLLDPRPGETATRETAAGETAHQRLDRLAAAVPAGCEGLLCLPYFLGEKTPLHDPFARGTFTGLSLNHTSGHLWRSLLEAFAYAQRHHVEVLCDAGHPVRRFFASDGGSRSRVWMGIVADVLQQRVQLLQNHHGSCVGAAWAAAMATGLARHWEDVSGLVRHGEVIEPDPGNAAAYARGYGEFRALYPVLRPFFRRANA